MAAPAQRTPLCASGSSELFLFYLLPREEGVVNSCFQMGKLGSEERKCPAQGQPAGGWQSPALIPFVSEVLAISHKQGCLPPFAQLQSGRLYASHTLNFKFLNIL